MSCKSSLAVLSRSPSLPLSELFSKSVSVLFCLLRCMLGVKQRGHNQFKTKQGIKAKLQCCGGMSQDGVTHIVDVTL